MARDISERYLAEQKLEKANLELEKLSFMDSLTQVSNRRRFDEQLQVLSCPCTEETCFSKNSTKLSSQLPVNVQP